MIWMNLDAQFVHIAIKSKIYSMEMQDFKYKCEHILK